MTTCTFTNQHGLWASGIHFQPIAQMSQNDLMKEGLGSSSTPPMMVSSAKGAFVTFRNTSGPLVRVWPPDVTADGVCASSSATEIYPSSRIKGTMLSKAQFGTGFDHHRLSLQDMLATIYQE